MIAEPETLHFASDARVPNNDLPVLIYRGAGLADNGRMLATFARFGWSNGWCDGIYPFHHFHTTSHEVLGVTGGRAQVRLGGESGRDATLQAGDLAVLPAGTGHKLLSSTAKLTVVGAYPDGCDWDLVRADEVDADRFARVRIAIAALPLPRTDPLFGPGGPLLRLWGGGRV